MIPVETVCWPLLFGDDQLFPEYLFFRVSQSIDMEGDDAKLNKARDILSTGCTHMLASIGQMQSSGQISSSEADTWKKETMDTFREDSKNLSNTNIQTLFGSPSFDKSGEKHSRQSMTAHKRNGSSSSGQSDEDDEDSDGGSQAPSKITRSHSQATPASKKANKSAATPRTSDRGGAKSLLTAFESVKNCLVYNLGDNVSADETDEIKVFALLFDSLLISVRSKFSETRFHLRMVPNSKCGAVPA